MGFNLRSLLLAAFIISNCVTWTASRHHFTHNALGHRSRHRRQGAGLYLPASFVIPGGAGGGAWGEWGEVSPCSRSCGGGVASQKRICLEIAPDGRATCTGGDTKYFSCETADCPGAGDFRAEQCAQYDDVPFRGIKYKWIPYTNGPKPCELNCMPKGERFYYRHKAKVTDGTRCSAESYDVCVDGTCQPVGCDMMLGSNAREDKCRECRGNGTNCHTLSGRDTTELTKGYNDILRIPQGATNIYIAEVKESNNYLALHSPPDAATRGKYFLNGDYHIDFPRALVIAGAAWHYERSQQGFAAPDRLRCLGPTTEPLILSLLVQDENVGVDYEYSIPLDQAPPPGARYGWVHDQFTPCSASCGGGFQTRNVTCRSLSEPEPLEQVSENLCDPGLRPASNTTCNLRDCAAAWAPGPWSPCTRPCGEGGTRSRQVHCEKIITNGVTFSFRSTVSDEECFELLGPKPALHEECNVDSHCPTWFTGPWKPCDKLCDEGKQSRQVVCHQKKNGRVEVLPDADCADEKPAAQQPCMLHPCEGVDWVVSDWTGCDNCLSLVKSRAAQCATKHREVVDAKFCANHPTPETEKPCNRSELPPCQVQWYATQWSNCSVECGKGVKTRRVFCGQFDGVSVVKVDDSKCENETKYNDTTACEIPQENCPAKWFAGPWSECTKRCGGGEQFRKTMCLSGGQEVSACSNATVLDSTQSCNVGPCDPDETLPVNAMSTPVMGEEDEEFCDEEEGEEVGAELDAGPDFDPGDLKVPDGYFSDAPEGSGSTSYGYSESESDFTSESEDTTFSTVEGSGDTSFTDETAETSTDFTETETDTTGSTESGATEAPESTDKSTGSDATESGATDISGSTDATGSDLTDETETTDYTSSTDSTLAGSGSTEVTKSDGTDTTGSTEAADTVGSEATETSGSEASTVSSGSSGSDVTENGSTESTVSEDTSSTVTENTVSTVTDETGSTGTESTESDITTATSESTSDSSTTEAGSTSETSDTSSSGSESSESTTEGLTESTSNSSDSSTTEGSTESATDETGSTVTEITGSTVTGSESTDMSGTTESGITETSVSTEYVGTESTDLTGSTEVTETGSTDVSTTEVTSESGPTETSESEGTEVTGSTTESSSTTEYTGSEDTSETGDTTPWDWATTLTGTTRRRCRPRHAKCVRSAFGCCPDNKTAAAGPFDEGCPTPKTCNETRFGCCPDGVSPAGGARGQGCPSARCEETLFGCCRSDNSTPAEGNDQEGCPPPPPACRAAKYGCCKDGKTGATGPHKQGCPETTTTTAAPAKADGKKCAASKFGCCHDNKTEAAGPNRQGCPCNATEFGCCPDNVTPANGTMMEGCERSCNTSAHGCCGDGETPAHGPGGQGCCLLYAYGCCPDNYKPAEGPHLEGCECQGTQFGCCPDNVTIARGANKEGCGCEFSEHGCCEDRHTEASGPKYEGCGCHTYQFGCCPDGETVAKGPNLQGCNCQNSEHGCCGDGVTAAGPDRAGCDCASSKYGCCPDGQTEATGKKFEGCTDIPENKQAACALAYDQGTCHNYTAHWYYDMQYGGCSRFWYGGCDGNGNRFLTKEECEDVCVHPPANDKCRLPKVAGSCSDSHPRWYYDAQYEQCGQFMFSGCLGNDNNFETRDSCQASCQPDRHRDQCAQSIEQGPCNGSFPRWGFDASAGRCQRFSWGGCGGSANRFSSEAACMLRCRPPGELQPECTQSQKIGNCTEKLPAWSFSATENRCLPFYYTGCGGNDNRFSDEQSCSAACPSAFEKQMCGLPAVTGECSNYRLNWYYDLSRDRCLQFYYGGCGGNGNNFVSEQDCQNRCAGTSTTTTQAPATSAVFKQEYCFLEKDPGPCSGSETRWAYSAERGDCEPFQFGGCGGNRNSFPSREYCQYYCRPAQDLCQLPMKTGNCEESWTRWFYDAASDRCSQFAYSGCDGNENNFGSHEECEQRCRTGPPARPAPAQPATTTVAPVQVSQECQVSDLEACRGVGRVWYLDPATGACAAHDPPAGEGGCRARGVFPSPEACERSCGAFRGLEVCRYPLDPGPCTERQPKFYFDAEAGACAPFTYGGCHGGPNRFSTIDECEHICKPQTDPCQLLPERGNCLEYHVLWYYDQARDDCNQFAYTGCGGNQNQFETREQCEGQCKRAPAPPTTPRAEVATPAPRPAEPMDEECRAPDSLEACGAPAPAWHWDAASGACVAAPNGACRYAGSWRSEEECERRCGAFRGLGDVCRIPLDPGPCVEPRALKFYWDMQELRCGNFTFGGCGGGANRFSSAAECEEVCGHLAPDPACRLPAAEGAACGPGAGERRWFHSALHGECRPFVYLGCGGNENNFLSFQQCVSHCSPPPDDNEIIPSTPDCRASLAACATLRCEYGLQRMRGADGCEACACIVREPNCAKLEEECANATCHYGLNVTRDADGCRRCGCLPHPCAERNCPAGQRCVPTAERDPVTQDVRYSADCRIENKPGACPAEEPPPGGCRRECGDDADCRGAAKCCAAGCSQLCRAPVEPAPAPEPDDRLAGPPRAPEPNPETEREVAAQEGGLATLRCLFHSNPPPKITWKRGQITIDGDKDRYRLTSDGALEIVSLYRNDSGVYICIAENDLGSAQQEVELRVQDPSPQAAGIAGPPEAVVSGEVGRPLSIRCLVYGHPAPSVAWFRGPTGPMVAYYSNQYEARGNVLLIRSLDVATLGLYTCQAYNGIDKPAQWTVEVRAPRRDAAWPASPYLLAPAEPRPARPAPPPRAASTTQSIVEYPYVPVYTAQVHTALHPAATTLAAGAELSLPCEVDGHPEPDVYWTKDGAPLQASDRLQLTAARLTLRGAAPADSGEYGCHAQNEFSSHSSSVRITVQELFIPEQCTDNQFFANCQLIVRSKFCNHKYYSSFCCKSCVEAGLLNPQDLQLQADQSWMKK